MEFYRRYQQTSSGRVEGYEAGLPVKDLCRRHGFSEGSYYLWRSKFGGMTVSDAKRLKELSAENTRLKKLLAESVLENEVRREALRKSGDRSSQTSAGAEHDLASSKSTVTMRP